VGYYRLYLLDGPKGRFVGFEVKSKKGRHRKNQRLWANAVRSAGGFVGVARTPEEALEALERAFAGASE